MTVFTREALSNSKEFKLSDRRHIALHRLRRINHTVERALVKKTELDRGLLLRVPILTHCEDFLALGARSSRMPQQ
jgi:hypothetical protein